MSTIEIRPVAVDERRAAADATQVALLHPPLSDERLERGRASTDASDALAAWDGDRCVGQVAAFRLDMVVPGGTRLPTAGVTRVGVLPTHTRRGLLRTMMDRLLTEAVTERGQPLAALFASEAPIYGRFGFGHATDHVSATITSATARPLRARPAPGAMRVLGRAETEAVVPGIYERCLGTRPGHVARDEWMWPWDLAGVAEPTSDRMARGHYVAVHADESGVDDGYVRYEAGWDDDHGDNPTAGGTVHELLGADAAVERALWEFVFDLDLVRTWKVPARPVDDPIRRALHDVRSYATVRCIDELWLRLLDVDVALGSRSYADAPGTVVIEVDDPLFAHNSGRWAISTAGAERTEAPTDLSTDVTALSAAYLGGFSWSQLAASGELAAPEPAVLTHLDRLFAVDPAPFCGTEF